MISILPILSRSFASEFNAETLERCRSGERSIGQVAQDFDLTETAVRKWVERARIDAGAIDVLTTEERQEQSRLRRKNKRLQADVDLLKGVMPWRTPPMPLCPEPHCARSLKPCGRPDSAPKDELGLVGWRCPLPGLHP
jgi:transposase